MIVLAIGSQKLGVNNLVIVVKTNLRSLFLQNYCKNILYKGNESYTKNMIAVRHNIYTTVIFRGHLLKMSSAKGTHVEINFWLIVILSQRRLRASSSQPNICLFEYFVERARNSHEVIVNEGEARVNDPAVQKLRTNNLIALLRTNLYSLFLQNYLQKRRIYKHCLLTGRYSMSIDE